MFKYLLFLFVFLTSFFLVSGQNISSCGINIVGDSNLTQNIISDGSSDCLTVTSDNLVLDCKGYDLTGLWNSSGINLNSRNNISVKNCNIFNFEYGIEVLLSSNNFYENIFINNSKYHGFLLDSSSIRNDLYNITSSNNNYSGIYLNSGSTNNSLDLILVEDNLNYGLAIYTNYNNFSQVFSSGNIQHGIFLSGDNNYFNEVNFDNNNLIGIYVTGNYNLFSNFSSDNNGGNGVSIQDSFNNLTSGTINNNAGSGVEIFGFTTNITIDSVVSNGNSEHGLYFEVAGDGSLISNSNFKNNNWSNLYFALAFGSFSAQNNTFLNNYFGSSLKINTETGSWNGFNNSFSNNIYTDFDGFLDGDCFDISRMACDFSRILEGQNQDSFSSIFPFFSNISLFFILGILFLIK